MKTLLRVMIVVLLLIAVPLEAQAGYQWGRDPDDSAGPGDIRIVSVRRFRGASERWLVVRVVGHDGADFWADGLIKWRLDARGGPKPDHTFRMTMDAEFGPTDCWLRIRGAGSREAEPLGGDGPGGDETVGCRIRLAETQVARRARFRSATVLDDEGGFFIDRAPNNQSRWYR
jgi:hypothetical protein